jgi:hypothetical protein
LDLEPAQVTVLDASTRALFAQVPMEYTGDPQQPVRADSEDAQYHIGMSPIWRGAKNITGTVLPWRFGRGEPFHFGFAWNSLDSGLKLMSKIAAK